MSIFNRQDINWVLIRAKLKEAVLVLPHFFKNPVQGMRMLPDWDWPTMLILQAVFAAICAAVANLLERDILNLFFGLILAPLGAIVVVSVAAGFFYYTFMFFFRREIPIRQIYLHLIFAAIPVQITVMAAPIVPPVILVGVAATLYLLFVGFTEVFQLERVKTKKMLIAIGLIYGLFWASQYVSLSNKHSSMRKNFKPESIDILEKEFKTDD